MIGTKIIAGELRGTLIGPIPDTIWARPILARIRKSLFDILASRVEGAVFLDLFCGSATVGIEAVSRGAKHVTFVDFNPQVQRWVLTTLEKLKRRNPNAFKTVTTEMRRADVTKGLAWLQRDFDLIFSGAPYVDQKGKLLFFITDLLKQIEAENLLRPNGWFVAQHSVRETFEVPAQWTLFRQERYGDSALSFFKFSGKRVNV